MLLFNHKIVEMHLPLLTEALIGAQEWKHDCSRAQPEGGRGSQQTGTSTGPVITALCNCKAPEQAKGRPGTISAGLLARRPSRREDAGGEAAEVLTLSPRTKHVLVIYGQPDFRAKEWQFSLIIAAFWGIQQIGEWSLSKCFTVLRSRI